jgi:ectoine hydroxylase-related dioxygenase (phytanoyl-CoA dioxygenase family)
VNGDRLVIPNGYQGFAAHQDWPSIQGSLDCVVSWVPLVPIHAQKFPLLVSPRSHLRGMLQGRIQANALEISTEDISDDSFIPVIVDVGDVVCMSSWMVHKTGVVGSQGMRISCSTRWDNAAEATFIERKYPCAYQRSVQRNLITPDFPSTEQVQAVFQRPLL